MAETVAENAKQIAKYLDCYDIHAAAGVNKAWNKAFSANAIWQDWDAYGLKRGIYADFLRRECPSRAEPAAQDEQDDSSDEEEDEYDSEYDALGGSDPIGNLYNMLSMIRQSDRIDYDVRQSIGSQKLGFYKALATRPLPIYPKYDHFSLLDVSHRALNNKELVCQLLKAGFYPRGLPTMLSNDPDAALSILQGTGSLDPYSFPTICSSIKFARLAVPRSPWAYFQLKSTVRGKEEIFYMQIESMRININKQDPSDAKRLAQVEWFVSDKLLNETQWMIDMFGAHPEILHCYTKSCSYYKKQPNERVTSAAIASLLRSPRPDCKAVFSGLELLPIPSIKMDLSRSFFNRYCVGGWWDALLNKVDGDSEFRDALTQECNQLVTGSDYGMPDFDQLHKLLETAVLFEQHNENRSEHTKAFEEKVKHELKSLESDYYGDELHLGLQNLARFIFLTVRVDYNVYSMRHMSRSELRAHRAARGGSLY